MNAKPSDPQTDQKITDNKPSKWARINSTVLISQSLKYAAPVPQMKSTLPVMVQWLANRVPLHSKVSCKL